MRYSVFSRSMGSYSIYESSSKSMQTAFGSYSLGAVPQDVSSILPMDAIKIGEARYPQGVIVDTDYSPKRFLFNFAIAASAFLFSSWIINKLR
mgnify:CR=1 FL=1